MRSTTMALEVTSTVLALSCTHSEPGAPLPPPSAITPPAAAVASSSAAPPAVAMASSSAAPPAVAVASPSAAPPEIPTAPGPFDARLLDEARAYAGWTKVTSMFGWASTDCAAPGPQPTLHAGTSKDDATHGQKLFHLFAKNNSAYVSDYKKPAPIGQVIVKESWHPVLVPPEPEEKPKRPGPDTVLREGKLYRKGERMGLFVMLKVGGKVAGTDQGWVYGVVSGDGTRVLASGRIASCMGCHDNAPGDRLFGPPN
jgi:Cytochrome P460